MKRVALFLFFFLAVSCAAVCLAGERHFKRVEQFPEGEQTHTTFGSFMGAANDWNVVRFTFAAPYERVWDAAKIVAKRLSKVGSSAAVFFDEENGKIVNGVINENGRLGSAPGVWMDSIQTEVTKVSEGSTKVLVGRRVVQKEATWTTGSSPWKAQSSNGKVENWVLTQIEDEIRSTPAEGQASAVATAPRPGPGGQQESQGQAAPAEKPLTNADVIALVNLQLGDDLVISKIQQAPTEALDVSTDALIKLKGEGVSKAVLDAMIKRASQRK